MGDYVNREPMLDMFIFETVQLIEQLELLVLDGEKSEGLGQHIHEIFRIMHTIKGSSAMMLFNNISMLAHAIEDVFYFLRENKPTELNPSMLTDIVLAGIDFIKTEINKIMENEDCDGDPTGIIAVITRFLADLKGETGHRNARIVPENASERNALWKEPVSEMQREGQAYRARLYFEEGCEMENIRAFNVIHNLKSIAWNIRHFPTELTEDEQCAELIRNQGFELLFSSSSSKAEVQAMMEETMFIRELKLEEAETVIVLQEPVGEAAEKNTGSIPVKEDSSGAKQSFISVNVTKMDKLMDLVGELVIAEAMVTLNPDLRGLPLDNFKKSARHLKKICGELQDIVMSVRMVPLATTFQKMNRIVRDMCRKLDKEVNLKIVGEDTEVDKNIIEHISDPIMHLIRNAIDHGLESQEQRLALGKPPLGQITLEAKNAGGDVWIIVQDDGKGLEREKILKKARENGLVHKPESELSDKEIYSFILLPGFSTKDSITEFSGRGVGMDVVTKNIEGVGGSVLIDSIPGQGTAISIKIPLTLAIIGGMTIKVGSSTYTVPLTSVRESFRLSDEAVIEDTEGNEMIMIRGECYPILRLHQLYKVNSSVTRLQEGIIMMVENGSERLCLFADGLLGEQQVVVKALPSYLKKIQGIAGCTLLGDGSISLILDVAGLGELVQNKYKS